MTLLIVFNDGTEKRIENVRCYEYGKGTGCFQYSIGNSTALGYVHKDELRYFGPEELWREPEKKPEADFDKLLNTIETYKYTYTKGDPYRRGHNTALESIEYVIREMQKEKKNES